MCLSFVKVALPQYSLSLPRSVQSQRCPPRQRRMVMELSSNGRASLYGGIGILAAVLTNRLLFTPLDSLALTQSRSDILGVITGATLVLYGVGKAEITDQKKAVQLQGVDLRIGFDSQDDVTAEVEWAASALIEAIPNVRSCAVVVNGAGQYLLGRFRSPDAELRVVPSGVIDTAMRKGDRAYLADMKTVPVKEVEFGFLPSNCQAAIVQPVTKEIAIVLGADKPRPFTSNDFGWLQAVSDRLGGMAGPIVEAFS